MHDFDVVLDMEFLLRHKVIFMTLAQSMVVTSSNLTIVQEKFKQLRTKPPTKNAYRMAPTELAELKKQLDGLLTVRFVRPAKVSYEGYLHLQLGYYQVRIPQENEPKTTWVTRYGTFEFFVMPFDLTNVPTTFFTLMNQGGVMVTKRLAQCKCLGHAVIRLASAT
ncbi:reverse transcriptase [Cucumis melo var. makuwa]|uniref:Reverse transcriptase n=1 Tax=Cucumis melo var. makuwa TaxID=1194695 RepID=A0A5A7UM78_CUCMM|nr:reverse transcriptase [Cucumis melo var. makuwa]TYK05258.1 reverse transcriptase [Cucumis melo var. makuwa]